MLKLYLAAFGAAIALLPALSQAAVTEKDIQVAGRVLGFTTSPPSGDVKLGIVYEPGNAASAKDKDDLVSLLGSGLKVGAVNFIPVPIPIDKLDTASADVLFETAGLGASGGKVAAATASKKILCITTDIAATQAGYCAVSVQTVPKVQITANKAAEAASGVTFGAAFKLMITEI